MLSLCFYFNKTFVFFSETIDLNKHLLKYVQNKKNTKLDKILKKIDNHSPEVSPKSDSLEYSLD